MARRSRQSWEEKLLELTTGGGVVVGLLSAANTAKHQPARVCRAASHAASNCLAHAMSGALSPYLKGAALGAAVGLVLGVALVLTWKYMRGAKSGPFAARKPAAVTRREAIPERVRHEVWRRDRGTCVDCGSRMRLEFDHIIPLSRGGSSTARNLEIRCESCNRAKGAAV